MTLTCRRADYYSANFNCFKMTDSATEEIQQYFTHTSHWIHSALTRGDSTNTTNKVLVNCWQGASRSATIVLAYLLTFTELNLAEAVKTVRECRDIRPNLGFLQQLIQLENKLNKTSN